MPDEDSKAQFSHWFFPEPKMPPTHQRTEPSKFAGTCFAASHAARVPPSARVAPPSPRAARAGRGLGFALERSSDGSNPMRPRCRSLRVERISRTEPSSVDDREVGLVFDPSNSDKKGPKRENPDAIGLTGHFCLNKPSSGQICLELDYHHYLPELHEHRAS